MCWLQDANNQSNPKVQHPLCTQFYLLVASKLMLSLVNWLGIHTSGGHQGSPVGF